MLIPGTHELSVEDSKKYSASAKITIAEPTVKVTPDIAGPRDYITITGENWAVDNPDSDESPSITVRVANGKMYTRVPLTPWAASPRNTGCIATSPSPAPSR